MTLSAFDRPRLPDDTIERIRRERYAPSVKQCDYLHLRDLRNALDAAFHEIGPQPGPALDLWCGTQPYRDMVPARPLWGVDLDRHFGRTDVVGGLPLPFEDGAFSIVVCTQALHLVDDPAATVREMARVLRPGGTAVVTVPHIFRREIRQERKLSAADLTTLFSGWESTVTGFGGLGSALAYFPASLANGAARRWKPLSMALPVLGLMLTGVGTVIDRVSQWLGAPRNASWIVVARTADSHGA